jgi:hypothetical protein
MNELLDWSGSPTIVTHRLIAMAFISSYCIVFVSWLTKGTYSVRYPLDVGITTHNSSIRMCLHQRTASWW